MAKQYKTGFVPFLLHGVADGPDAAKLFQADRIHPKEEAHPVILDNVWPELRKLLPAGAEPPPAGQGPRGGRTKPVGVPGS